MALKINHPEKPTEENKIDDNKYMDDHTVSGTLDYSDIDNAPDVPNIDLPPGTYRVKKLIESKDVSNASSVTFSGLDGDTDGIYVLEFDFGTSGTTSKIYLVPNTSPGSTKYGICPQGGITNLGTGSDNTKMIFFIGAWSQTWTRIMGELTLYAKTGGIRMYRGNWVGRMAGNGEPETGTPGGFWTDTTTNITSLTVQIDTVYFTGTFKLYKIVDMVVS